MATKAYECGLWPLPAVELIRSLNRLNFQVAALGSAVNVDKNEIVKLLNTKYGCEKNKTIQNACAEQELNKTNCLNIQEAHWVEAWFQFIQSQNIPFTQCTAT